MANTVRPVRTILREPAVLARIGLSRSTFRNRIKAGEFPAGFPLGDGARAVGWLESDVDAWLESQVQKSRKSV